eukprot:518552-Prymnesium_polylepis.1
MRSWYGSAAPTATARAATREAHPPPAHHPGVGKGQGWGGRRFGGPSPLCGWGSQRSAGGPDAQSL